MRYGSVCSGIEAATVAWHGLGWEPAFFAEIDPFPSAVLAERFPGVRNLGDFTTIRNRWIRRLGVGSIDLLVGGTPCQSFSVAGLRGGLADARGNLALEFLRLARRLRPSWVVWENVPGVLSSWTDEATFEASQGSCRDVEEARRACIEAGIDPGAEFGPGAFEEVDQTNDLDCFLAGLEELGYGWAYRVLDAQYAGVPQRRRRVFVVGHLGDWRRAAAVLFERHSLSGDPPPSRAARANVAGSLGGGSGNRGWCDDLDRAGAFIPDAARSLLSKHNLSHREDADNLVAFAPDVAFGLQSSVGRNENGSRIGNGWNTNYVAHTLRADGFDASEDGSGRGTPLVPTVAPTLFASTGGASSGYHPVVPVAYQQHGTNVGPMGTLRKGNGSATGGVPFIVNAAESCATESHARQSETARCLDSQGGFATNQGGTVVAMPIRSAVRRLTPREAERLQGFPDDFTLVRYRGKPAADGPRYRALGNSMAVPCMRWIGERIALVTRLA